MNLGFSYSLLLAQSVFVKLLFFFSSEAMCESNNSQGPTKKKKKNWNGCFICSAAGSSPSLYTYITLSPSKCSACRGGNLQRSAVFQRQHVETSEQKFGRRLSLMPRAATAEDWALPVNLHRRSSLMLRPTVTVQAADLSSTWQRRITLAFPLFSQSDTSVSVQIK